VITRAVERGQALASADAEAVSQVFPALAFHRGAALGLPVDEEFVVRVVDNLLMPLLKPPGRPGQRRVAPTDNG
jgi:hypothetical protein